MRSIETTTGREKSHIMFKHVIMALLFFPLFGLAQQQDYLVYHQGDTIYGEYLKRNSIHKYVRFRTDAGTIKIPSKDVREFYWNNRKYRVYEDPCEGGLSDYMVLIEGTVSFLHSGGREDECPDLIIIDNEIYPIKRKRYFSEEVWNKLSTCPAFEEMYKADHDAHMNQTIIWEWTYRKSRIKYLEMIGYYNANCGNKTN